MDDYEHEKFIWSRRQGMDYSIYCIAKAMMEDFDPNAVLLGVLTNMTGLYGTYARHKAPDNDEYKHIVHQLQFAIDAVEEAMAKRE